MIVKVLRVEHSRSDNSFLFLKVRHFVNIVDASSPNLLLNYVSVSLIVRKMIVSMVIMKIRNHNFASLVSVLFTSLQ